MSKQECVLKKTSIGGQALIEGVMMRGPERTAMAVRHTSGEIRTEAWDNAKKKPLFFAKWPLIRGLFGMASSLTIGYKCLMRSAELSGLEEELEDAMKEERTPDQETVTEESPVEETSAEEAPVEETPVAEPEEKKKTSLLMTLVMIVGVVLGVALSLVLFMWLPIQLFDWLKDAFPGLDNRYLRGVFEGVVRIAIFLGYMVLVSRMKDIRRTFMYHGAEHKSIFCYEKGLPLTVENVRKQKRFHPRCGTSFLILMLVVGIILSILIPITDPVWRTVVKLAMLPLTVGVGYELIKLAGRYDNWFTRLISIPGMWMQHLTTVEPDDSMIECAIVALQAVIPEDPEADQW
ncbi:MAG: DUF1385 domain-containing protein [Ruminococcaceae bacterium]|nr:DUF1385 domain-containing protein [Oscillospiraceae bacterium]